MTDDALTLSHWATFFTLTGSSAAALTGLMFIVITLVTASERRPGSREGVSTFSTPTVVHFGAALLVSAILCAPWHGVVRAVALVGLTGAAGLVYMARVVDRSRVQTAYVPDLEDRIWYSILPPVGYGALLVAGFVAPHALEGALFVAAAGVLSLTFVGIHNAWDIVTYIAIDLAAAPPPREDDAPR